jgi:signal transduction histidine kinase
VSISLRVTANVLKLVISDDGRGMRGPAGQMEVGAAGNGVGIPGMRARLRDFGGSLEIRSGSQGTTLSAVIPLGTAKRWPRAPERVPALVALDGNPHQT